jgi:pimeloyl-ACP methyl ester carboxylesterase
MSDSQPARHTLPHAPEWAEGFTAWLPERVDPVRRVGYTLRDLVRRGLIDEAAAGEFHAETLLADFAWRLLWADENTVSDTESIGEALRTAEGIVVFIHGWDGSGDIWEDLPALVVQQNPRLVALVPDVNGFGGTPFSTDFPPIEKCDPPALIASVERWLDLLMLRSPEGAEIVRPFVFVGHSMGGASLFFLDESHWRPAEAGRIAAAPAILLNDRQRQNFYKALGTGIQISGMNSVFDRITENVLAPRMIEALAGWGSERVLAEHHRIYKNTHEGVIARTFAAMGMLEADLFRDSWPFFDVYLAHKDRLVGIATIMELLEEINFDPPQIHLALGDHYFFSIGEREALHTKNRAMLLDGILSMACRLLDCQR